MHLTDLFRDPDRVDAETAARELTHQAERLGFPLRDIEIIAPCTTCRRTHYALTLGALTPLEADQLARALKSIHIEVLPAAHEGDG